MPAKKINGRTREKERPLLDDLFGSRAAGRLRGAALLLLSALFFGGCALFLAESQTLGGMALALGLGGALAWMAIRSAGGGGDPLEAVHRSRAPLVAVGFLLVATGWVVFFALWEELGLLLVLLGAVPLAVLLVGMRQEPLASPMDGPPFGDTGPT